MEDYPLSMLFGILIILFLLSGFFAGSETALMALNRYRVRHLANHGHRGAQYAQRLLKRPDKIIGLILVGNNIVNILAAQLAAYIGYRIYGELGIAIATAILTVTLLVFSEVTPKTFGALHSEKIAFPAAIIYTPLLTVTYPLVWLINLISNGLLSVFGVNVKEASLSVLSREELRTVVNESRSLLSKQHQRMMLSVFDLEKVTVEDIMIHRSDIVGVDLENDLQEITNELTTATYTRLPVYRGAIDHVVGILHVKQVLRVLLESELTIKKIEENVKPPCFIPEGTSLQKQLLNFQREKRRMGFVVDEFGDIQGLVTLEDLLEEIVGEFTSDPADISPDIHPQNDGACVVDGSARVRDINRALNWDLHIDGPKTINGLILEHMETIPPPGTSVLIDGYPMEIVQIGKNAIRTVRMKPKLASYKEAV